MRPIKLGVPSNKVKMTLWASTEDERDFIVKGLKSNSPYVTAYGVKYYLTKEEVGQVNLLKGLGKKKKKI